jgi:hypothetical protein
MTDDAHDDGENHHAHRGHHAGEALHDDAVRAA